MKKNHIIKLFPSLALAGALVQSVFALPDPATGLGDGQPPAPPTRVVTFAPRPGASFIYLDFGDQDIHPVAPSRITVPAGDAVTLHGTPASIIRPIQWLKNGQPIPDATGNYLKIPSATRADAGVYSARFTTLDGKSITSQLLILGVAPAERLVNLSMFTSLPAGRGEALIAGFVVNGGPGAKKMLVRAVGPSLAIFGFAHVLRQPVLRLRDATGKLYENEYIYPAVEGGPTYESDLAESLTKVGAFTTPVGNADAVRLMPFTTGSYTVEVTSTDNTAGAVLLEIYEVP